MPEKPSAPRLFKRLRGAKAAVRAFVLTFAMLGLTGAAAFAQTAQQAPAKPAPAAQAPAAASSKDISGDTDKMRVQDRWGTSSGPAAPKAAKPGKTEKPKTATPPVGQP